MVHHRNTDGPQAVVGLIKVPWDRANEQLHLQVRLEDEDGSEIVLPGPDGSLDQRIEFEATVEVGRPPGLKHGTPIDSTFAISVQPMPLAPGRYTWRLQIADDVFTASFSVLAQMPAIPS